jgi:hypothetical protein
VISHFDRGLESCGKVLKANTADKTKTCIITKGVDATLLPQLSCGNLTAAQLRLKLVDGTHRNMIIGSAYMPYDSEDLPPQEEIKSLVVYAKDKGLELFWGCDANPHHEVWGSTNINARGESLLDFIMHTRLHILNRGKEPTFLDSRRQEMLDITLCTRGLVGLVRDWKVFNESCGSDHRQIHFTLDQIQIEKKWGRNPGLTNWTGYKADLESQLKKAPNRFYSKEDLEMASQFVSDDIKDSFEMNCPVKLKNLSTHVPWWNKELTKLRVEVRRLFNRARNSSKEGNWERFRKAQLAYKKAAVFAKRNSWRCFCEGIEKVPETSRLHRILSQENRTYLGSSKLFSGGYTELVEESLGHLMDVHFPGSWRAFRLLG